MQRRENAGPDFAKEREKHSETKYGYDLLGNLTAITRGADTETRTHDGQLQGGVLRLPHALTTRTIAGQTSSFSHDARGRQTAGSGREIEWKPFDLPARIHRGIRSWPSSRAA